MWSITIDWRQGDLVFGNLLEALKKLKFPYPYIKPPNAPDNMPPSLKTGSRMNSNFLWKACYYMKGGIKSHTAITSLGKLYEHDPKIFDPFNALGKNRKRYAAKITKKLRQFGLGFSSEQIGFHWVDNDVKLATFWNGDPAEFFKKAKSYEELCGLIMRPKNKKFDPSIPTGFLGFREKMVSMITYFLMFAGIVSFSIFPVPVDFHILRLLVANGVLKIKWMRKGSSILTGELLAKAREATVGYCHKHGVSPMDLCDALWLLSSTICKKHPGNQSHQYKYRTRKGKKGRKVRIKVLVPTGKLDLFGIEINDFLHEEVVLDGKGKRLRYERRGRKTIIDPVPITWSRSQVRAYEDSCGLCPIERTCKHCIPSAPYFIRGEIHIRGRRTRPPEMNLLLQVDH